MIKEKELFELSLENNLEEELYLDYHIRGIATKEGLEFYYQYKNVK